MNKVLIIIFLSILLIQCRENNDLQPILDEIEQSYVPDRRTGIFNIHAEPRASKIFLTGETDNEKAHVALIKKLENAGYTIVDSIVLLPYKTTQPWAIVNLSVANMRLEPSHGAELVTQALMGTPLRILKETDDWALVQTPDNYISWCEKDAISFCSNKDFTQWQKSKRVIITDWFGFLRDSLSQDVVTDFVAGCILEYKSNNKGTAILSTPDGRRGSISKNSFTDFSLWKQKGIPAKDKLVETAKVFMGVPYLWGGSSIKGVDCSGFVKMVYFLNGYIIPRDASQQVQHGTEITQSKNFDYLPGDLVFFGRRPKGDKPARITHVGMYLGDSEFIHSSGLVRVNSFDSTRTNYSRYRTISLLKVRRILNSSDKTGIFEVKSHPWYQ